MNENSLVVLKNISKSFGNVRANSNVNISIEKNSIHGLVGENGAGKSTIMKVLYGIYPPDEGTIELRGKPVRFESTEDAIRSGIGMVFQHFMLVPTLTVLENIILGAEPAFLLRGEYKKNIEALCVKYGMTVPLEAKVEDLSVGEQQQIEILKVLYRKAEVLILDEPSQVLTPQEVDKLFISLRTLWKSGKTIILITHKMREILSFTERVTIMRQGKVVDTLPSQSLNESSLSEKMVGRKIGSLPKRQAIREAKVVLSVKGVSLLGKRKCRLQNVSFDVKEGEILGIAGVEGNGQKELSELLAHTEKDYDGEIIFKGNSYRNFSTYALKQNGLSVVPPDRLKDGGILSFTIFENMMLGHHREKKYLKKCLFSQSRIKERAQELIYSFDIRPPDIHLSLKALSGGNQQKVILAKELVSENLSLLVACHPTRGVDIGAIESIHGFLLNLRNEKKCAVILFSSELDEILALSDRIIVMFGGLVCGEAMREETDERRLGFLMTGGKSA